MLFGPSNMTGKVDTAFLIILGMCIGLLIVITTLMIYFLIRYRSKKNPVPSETDGNTVLEIVWTVIPIVLVLLMFYYGWVDFDYIRDPPKDAMKVDVTGRQWAWSFRYKNGRQSGELRVPMGKPVELLLTSADVIHGFFIPAYRIKEDTVPGMKTHLWFIADRPGTFDIFCTEYCGLGHSHMRSKLIAMPEGKFREWYEAKAGPPEEGSKEEQKGHELFESKGCVGCHSVDGSPKVGPTLKSIYGKQVTVVTNGKERTIRVDDEYLARSIKEPQADLVKGFPPVMPKIPMTGEEQKEITAYIESLR